MIDPEEFWRRFLRRLERQSRRGFYDATGSCTGWIRHACLGFARFAMAVVLTVLYGSFGSSLTASLPGADPPPRGGRNIDISGYQHNGFGAPSLQKHHSWGSIASWAQAQKPPLGAPRLFASANR